MERRGCRLIIIDKGRYRINYQTKIGWVFVKIKQIYNIGTGDTRELLTSFFEDVMSHEIFIFKELQTGA